MSHDQIGKTTRRDFLGTATAATALTLGSFTGCRSANCSNQIRRSPSCAIDDRSKRTATATGYP